MKWVSQHESERESKAENGRKRGDQPKIDQE
jgi:hypothetical protein